MKLLVTTSYSVLELDTNNSNLRRVHNGSGLYYGITRYNKNIYIASRNRMVSSSTLNDNERGEILVFSASLKLENHIQAPFPLRDMHQISWHDNKLWITCSYDNLIAIFDGNNWTQWNPLSETPNCPKDIHHYNSLRFEDNVIWVLAHNHGKSELLSFALQTKKLLSRSMLGYQSHNIWKEDGQVFTCSSAQGEIIGNKGFRLNTSGFPRGYTCDGNNRYVGISELAERKERDLTTGKILIFNMNWELKKTISLPNEGLILDMLPLKDEDNNYQK